MIRGKTFDLILCIESFHCIANQDLFLREAYAKLADNPTASFVIADSFDKNEIANIEKKLSADDNGFVISKKEVITFNVKHSMQLDKPRIEKMISHMILATANQVVHRVFRNFMASGE